MWSLTNDPLKEPDALVEIPPEWSWKLFSKNVRPREVLGHIHITGDEALGKKVLDMVSVMA